MFKCLQYTVLQVQLRMMKQILGNLILFVALSVVFSALTSCRGDSAVNGGANQAGGGNTADGKASAYPLLPTSLSESNLELLDGTITKISDHKGKVLLLNIWGTWCGPCRAEMPHLIVMQDKYREQGLEIIGMNIGDGGGQPESVEDIKKFAVENKLNYTLVRTPGSAIAAFYILTKQQVVPQTILVDRGGHTRGVFVGGGQQIIDSMNKNLDIVMAE